MNYLTTITDFVRSVGIEVIFETIAEETFLPGILISNGQLIIDTTQLLYPGDVLHEAGHIAAMPAAERHSLRGNVGMVKDASEAMGEEMMAIAWSYAACVATGIPPEIVFHEHGYKGASQWYIAEYTSGNHLSLPLMQWAGFCYDPKNAVTNNTLPYPSMIRWLRE
ncbi:hypothetical protein [Taibaiella soli]|uniref:Uncharacterized protein n=1 Tax=Taibaiella soli TaxID=1649169 RepID=A0A2W2C231_9BACT|nr:hypothetical protein [Taibaiella soli]PZF74133.1 hypothetical protein DN068_03720 [Taibaiella soli]